MNGESTETPITWTSSFWIPLLLATVLFGRTAPDARQRRREEIPRTDAAAVETAA